MSSTDEDFYVPDTEEQTEVQDILYIQDPKDNCDGQSTWAIEDSTNVQNVQEYLVIQEIQGNPQDTLDVQDGIEDLGTLDSQEEKEAAIKNTLKELLIYTFFLVVISTGNREHFYP
jgi:hypothetical protein